MSGPARTRRIAATPTAVWDRLAAFDRIVEWAPPVDHSTWLTAATDGAGCARRVQVGATTLVERVVTWEPGRELAYTIEGLPPVVSRVENRWRIEPDGDGSLVTLTVDVAPGPRPPMRLVAPLVARRLAAANQSMLDGLAADLEARASADATRPADPEGTSP